MNVQKNNFIVLRVLSALGMYLIMLPLIICSDAAVHDNISFVRIIMCYGMGIAAGIVGFGAAYINNKKKWQNENAHKVWIVFTRVLGIAVGIIPFLFAGFFSFSLFRFTVIGLTLIFGYYIGYKFQYKSFSDIFTMPWLAGYIITLIFSYLFYGEIAGDFTETGRSIMVYAALVEALIVVILINQTNISVLSDRRRETKALIPKHLRAYNSALIIDVAVIFGAVYTFRNRIAWFIEKIIQVIFWLIDNLLKALSSSPVDVTSEDIQLEQAEIEIIQGNELVDLIIRILFILTVIVLILVFHKKIWAAIKYVFRMIAGYFTRRDRKSENDDYAFTDYFEPVVYEKRGKKQKITLKAYIKAYKREKNPEKKYRLGYRSFMLWMKMNNIPPRRSDTANSHFDKSKDIFTGSNTLLDVVELYNNIRYNGKSATDENLAEMDKLISQIEHG